MSFKVGDRVRTTVQPYGGEFPLGAEGYVQDQEHGFFLFVMLDDYQDNYDGVLDDEAHRGTWALTADEVELIEVAA